MKLGEDLGHGWKPAKRAAIHKIPGSATTRAKPVTTREEGKARMSSILEAVVRTARPDETQKLIETYASAARELPPADADNLLPRPFEEVDAAVRQGLFLVIEDAEGQFLAGSGVFDLSDPNYALTDAVYREALADVVVDLRGRAPR